MRSCWGPGKQSPAACLPCLKMPARDLQATLSADAAAMQFRHCCALTGEPGWTLSLVMLQAYCAAIERAVHKVRAEAGQAHALDLGCGTGLFALAAARAGAASVLACDLHEPLCTLARRVRPPECLCNEGNGVWWC